MKVEADLRVAIKAVASEKKRSRWDWEGKKAANTKAINAFMRGPHGDEVRKAKAKKDKAKKMEQAANTMAQEAYAVLRKLGLSYSQGKLDISDEDAFSENGGKYDPKYHGAWTADQVIAELVASPEKDKAAILKKYGIIWGNA